MTILYTKATRVLRVDQWIWSSSVPRQNPITVLHKSMYFFSFSHRITTRQGFGVYCLLLTASLVQIFSVCPTYIWARWVIYVLFLGLYGKLLLSNRTLLFFMKGMNIILIMTDTNFVNVHQLVTHQTRGLRRAISHLLHLVREFPVHASLWQLTTSQHFLAHLDKFVYQRLFITLAQTESESSLLQNQCCWCLSILNLQLLSALRSFIVPCKRNEITLSNLNGKWRSCNRKITVKMMEKTIRISYVHVLDGWKHFSSKISGDSRRILPQTLNNGLWNFASHYILLLIIWIRNPFIQCHNILLTADQRSL